MRNVRSFDPRQLVGALSPVNHTGLYQGSIQDSDHKVRDRQTDRQTETERQTFRQTQTERERKQKQKRE